MRTSISVTRLARGGYVLARLADTRLWTRKKEKDSAARVDRVTILDALYLSAVRYSRKYVESLRTGISLEVRESRSSEMIL